MINIGLVNIVLGIPWWVFIVIPAIIILAVVIYIAVTSYFY